MTGQCTCIKLCANLGKNVMETQAMIRQTFGEGKAVNEKHEPYKRSNEKPIITKTEKRQDR
jgi:hypothetical protein